MDFPVAFVTNVLYVCEKNGQRHLLNDPVGFGEEEQQISRRLQSFYDIIKSKQDFMHVEGLSHLAYVLDRIGKNEDKQIRATLMAQLLERPDDNFQIQYVSSENWKPTSFEYYGDKGGLLSSNRGNSYDEQQKYTDQVQRLFFEDQYYLIELK